MKNKKGFTLVELLAVIALIALLALVVVPTVMNLVSGSNKDKLDSTTKSLIFSAADNFLDYNQTDYIKGENAVYCITFQKLIDKGFLEKDLKDISSNQTMQKLADEGYGIKSTYEKKLFKNKFEHTILRSEEQYTQCKSNEEYFPVLNGLAIGELSYYRYNTTDENNRRNKIYSGIDQMYVVVPVEAPKLAVGIELSLNIRKGSNHIDDFTTLKTNLGNDHKAVFTIEVPTGMKIGEYVIEVTDENANKATKNLRIYTNPIILFMGE